MTPYFFLDCLEFFDPFESYELNDYRLPNEHWLFDPSSSYPFCMANSTKVIFFSLTFDLLSIWDALLWFFNSITLSFFLDFAFDELDFLESGGFEDGALMLGA